MKTITSKNLLVLSVTLSLILTGCATKKDMLDLNAQLDSKIAMLDETKAKLDECNQQKMNTEANFENEKQKTKAVVAAKNEVIGDLRLQIDDLKKQREQQSNQVDNLTVLSKTASDNIGETIKELDKKNAFILKLTQAQARVDSMNQALALNLQNGFRNEIANNDIQVKIDKTLVAVTVSDSLLFEPTSFLLAAQSNSVLEKIAILVNTQPELEVLIEGYTDDARVVSSYMEDNWDMSVKRATSVVRVLQKNFGVNPNKLIAGGRSEYNALADNSTEQGRSTNRRTRIILMTNHNQLYDLLKPINTIPK